MGFAQLPRYRLPVMMLIADSTSKEGKPVSHGMNMPRGRGGKFIDHGSRDASYESGATKLKGRGRGGSSRSPSRASKPPHQRKDGTTPKTQIGANTSPSRPHRYFRESPFHHRHSQ